MNTNSPSSSKGDLTPARFEGLLLRLDSDRDQAGAKYEELRRKMVRFFEWGCCRDAESLVDETFDRVAEKLASEGEEVRSVAAFAWGIARKVRQEAMRKDAKTISLPEFFFGDGLLAEGHMPVHPQHEAAGDWKRIQCLRKCMQSLSDGERRLFVTYHFPGGRRAEGRRRLAREIGITAGALRIRANRLRFKLAERITRYLVAMTA